jgi:hypothetical protein
MNIGLTQLQTMENISLDQRARANSKKHNIRVKKNFDKHVPTFKSHHSKHYESNTPILNKTQNPYRPSMNYPNRRNPPRNIKPPQYLESYDTK